MPVVQARVGGVRVADQYQAATFKGRSGSLTDARHGTTRRLICRDVVYKPGFQIE